MFPNNNGERCSSPLEGSVHRCLTNPGKLFVGVGPVNDENLQNIRIQMAVSRYNGSNSPTYRQFSPSAYRCSVMRPTINKSNDASSNTEQSEVSNIATMLYSRPRQLIGKDIAQPNDSLQAEGCTGDTIQNSSFAKQKWSKKTNTQSVLQADVAHSSNPEFRYTGPEQFPTCLLNKKDYRIFKRNNILSQLKSPDHGLPITRYMDDSAEKYSDLKSTRSVLDVLQDLSRKRIHGKDIPEEQVKRRCRGLGGEVTPEGEAMYKPLFVPKTRIALLPKRDQATQTSVRVRAQVADQAVAPDPKWELRRKLARQNNEILASFSSSVRRAPLLKRKEQDTEWITEKQDSSGEDSEKKLKVDKSSCSDVNPEIEQEMISKSQTSKEPTSPKSPNGKDRLMTIFLDLKNSSEAKANAIKSLLDSPGDKQFLRSPDKVVDNKLGESPRINGIFSGEVPPFISPIVSETSKSPTLSTLPKPVEKVVIPAPKIAPILFKPTSSVVTSASPTLPTTVEKRNIEAAAGNEPPSSVTTISTKPEQETISIQKTSLPVTTKETPMFSFGLPKISSPSTSSSVKPSITCPQTLSTVPAMSTSSTALSSSKLQDVKPLQFSVGSSSPPKQPIMFSGISIPPVKEIPSFHSSFPAVNRPKEDTSLPAVPSVTTPVTSLFAFGESTSPKKTIVMPTTSTLNEVKPAFGMDSTFEFGKNLKNPPVTTLSTSTPTTLAFSTSLPSSGEQFKFQTPNISVPNLSATTTSGLSLFTATEPKSDSNHGLNDNKPLSNTEVKWSFDGSIASVNTDKSNVGQGTHIFGPTAAQPVTNMSPVISKPSLTTIPLTADTVTSKPAVFSRLGDRSKMPFTFGVTKPESEKPPNFGVEDTKNSSSAFSFGANNSTEQAQTIFKKPTSSIFGQLQNSIGASTPVFGQGLATTNTISPGITQNVTNISKTSPAFGQTQPSNLITSSSVFGKTLGTSSSANSLFDLAQTTTAKVNSVFGQTAATTVVTASTFGLSQTTTAIGVTSEAPSQSIFSNLKSSTTTTASTFGGTASSFPLTNVPIADPPVFGQSNNLFGNSAPMFGQDASKFGPSTTSGGPVFNFGGAATTSAPTAAFGPTSSTFAFSGNGSNPEIKPATSTAAVSSPAQNLAFGQSSPAFGTTSNSSSFGSTFGASTAPTFGQTPTPSAFGQPGGFSQTSAGQPGSFSQTSAGQPGGFSQTSAGQPGGFSQTPAPTFGSEFPTTTATAAPVPNSFSFNKTSTAGTVPFAFGSSQAPGFGSTTSSTASSSPFASATSPAFGTSTSTVQAPASFTVPTPTTAAPFQFGAGQGVKPSNPIFNFGASTPAQSASTGFNFSGFGSTTSSTGPFGFSGSTSGFGQTPASSVATSVGFGQVATPSTGNASSSFRLTPTPSSGALSTPFGPTSTPNSAVISSPFGQTPTPLSGGIPTHFGQSPTPTSAGISSPFGQTPTPSSGGMSTPFGQTPTPSSGGLSSPFGQASVSSNSGLSTAFGQTPTPNPGGMVTPFGQTPSPGAFAVPVPGTFSIGSGSSQSRSRALRNRRKY